jgi:2,5-diketo-D-gluconate reductase B
MDYLLTAHSPVAKGRVLYDATLKQIGEAHGKTPAQVALRWLIQQEKVSAIPKAANEDHLRSNFDIFNFELSDEEIERVLHCGIRDIARPSTPNARESLGDDSRGRKNGK